LSAVVLRQSARAAADQAPGGRGHAGDRDRRAHWHRRPGPVRIPGIDCNMTAVSISDHTMTAWFRLGEGERRARPRGFEPLTFGSVARSRSSSGCVPERLIHLLSQTRFLRVRLVSVGCVAPMLPREGALSRSSAGLPPSPSTAARRHGSGRRSEEDACLCGDGRRQRHGEAAEPRTAPSDWGPKPVVNVPKFHLGTPQCRAQPVAV